MRSQVTLWIGLALVIAARMFAFWLIPLCAEDAYITFHAALDPAWRAATTSPLWAMLCGLGDPPTVARAIALVADCAAVWAAWRVLPGYGYWAFVVLWLSPFFMGSAVSGLETHVAACALVLARAWPGGFAIAAALRPDAAGLALITSGKRWRWAILGAAALALAGLCFTGNILPQTVGSKLAVYGWQGLQLFWWYKVAPIALAGFWLCKYITRPWQAAIAIAAALWFWPGQADVLHERIAQERALWHVGSELAKLHPHGTILLEPAGMIAYQNRGLRVVDDVGLIEPWMANARKSDGWRTAAIERYRPDWIVVRVREYLYPNQWRIGSTSPYHSFAESRIPGYGYVMAPGASVDSTRHIKVSLRSSSLLVLRRMYP